jgi:hypothetical protein
MKSSRGNAVPNQFIIENGNKRFFQSYKSIIVMVDKGNVTLDNDTWNYSRTTAKYRNIFLGETTKEIESKINNGDYILKNLNEGYEL